MIKNALVAMLLTVSTLCTVGLVREKDRRLTLAELSYTEGCLAFAVNHCPNMPEEKVVQCATDALEGCESSAKEYRNWLENKK